MKKTAVAPVAAAEERPALWPFLKAAHAAEALLEQALAGVGLSGAKQGALSKLVAAGGSVSLGDLASRLTCVRSNITQLMDRLEADGLVRREEDPRDRRAVLAVVTPLGYERQKVGAERIAEVQRRIESALAGFDPTVFERIAGELE